jgi:TolB protein
MTMPDLMTDLRRGADAFGRSPTGLDDLRVRRGRLERRHRVAAALTAFAITASTGGALWAVSRSRDVVSGGGATVTNGPITYMIGQLGGSMTGSEIASSDADGSDRSTLTEGVRDFVTGGWSPDGSRFVFMKEGAEVGDTDIWVIGADGSGARRLTHGPLWDGYAQFSPIGDRIAFVRMVDGTDAGSPPGLYVMNADGTDVHAVIELHPHSSITFFSWSPDGRRFAFTSYGAGDKPEGVFTIDADGTDRRQIFDGSGGTVLWSPDGSRLLFDSRLGVSVTNADGSDLRTLIAGEQMLTYESFRWSPDGSQILSVRPNEQARSDELWVMDADGSDDRRVAENLTWREGGATWSPDGTQIAFNRDGDIWVVALDGSGERQVTDSPVYESMPAWGAGSAP